MRILIISWWFPPCNEVASGRPYSWARYFAERGHSVTVLTCQKDPRLHPDLSLPWEPHPNLRIVETPLRLLNTPVAKGASWAFGSFSTVRRLARENDVIISTFMPWYVHLLGHWAKRAHPRAFWCADYRDLWSSYDYFMNHHAPLRRWFHRRFEQAVVRPADLTVTVSPPLAESLSRTHPHIPSATIYNGFPEAEYQGPQPETRLAERAAAGKPFEIVYTGTLYDRGYHDPEPLFRAIAQGAWRRPIRLWFYGRSAHSPVVRELRDQYGLQEVVQLPEKPLPRPESVRRQQEADLLFHASWTNPGMDGVLTGKVFEYMAAGVPILSVGAGPEAAISRLLAKSGTGLCVGRDEAAITRVLDEMVNRNRYGDWFRPDAERVRFYSRERQAQALLDLLEKRLADRENDG
jgi:glycosyltransferase involved in cell wall biosynthesis